VDENYIPILLFTLFYSSVIKSCLYFLLMENTYHLSTDKSKLDVAVVFDYLSNQSYWAKGRSLKLIEKSIEHFLCFGVFDDENNQVGFARLASDLAVFAWLMDVFILANERRKGFGKLLIKKIINYPALQDVKKCGFCTKDTHGLYHKFGFKHLAKPANMMELKVVKL